MYMTDPYKELFMIEENYKINLQNFTSHLKLNLYNKSINQQITNIERAQDIVKTLKKLLSALMIKYGNYLEKFSYIFLHDLDAESLKLINAYICYQKEYRNIIQDDYHLPLASVAGIESDHYGKLNNRNKKRVANCQLNTRELFLKYEKAPEESKTNFVPKITEYMKKYTREYDFFINLLVSDSPSKKKMQNQLLRNNLAYNSMISDYKQVIKYLNMEPDEPTQTTNHANTLLAKAGYLENKLQESSFSVINRSIKDLVFPIQPYMPNENGAVNHDLVDVVKYYFQDVINVIMVNAISMFNVENRQKLVVVGGNALSRMYNLNYREKYFNWDLHIVGEKERNIEKVMAIFSRYLNDYVTKYELFYAYLNNAISNINNYFKLRNIAFVIQPYTDQTISLLPDKSIFAHYTRGRDVHLHKIQFICNNSIQHVDLTDIQYDYYSKIGGVAIDLDDCYIMNKMIYISITHIVRSLLELACDNSDYRKTRQVFEKIFFLKKNLLSDVFDCSFLQHLQYTDELSKFSSSVMSYMNSNRHYYAAISGDFVEKSITYICQNIEKITQNQFCEDMFLSTDFNDTDHVPAFLFDMIRDSNEYLINKCETYHIKQECDILRKLIRYYTRASAFLNNFLSKYYYSKDASILQKMYNDQTVGEYTQNMNQAIQTYHKYGKFQQYYDRTITIYKSCHFFNLPVFGEDAHEISAGDNIYQPCFNSTSYSKNINFMYFMNPALPFYIMEIKLRLSSPCYMILDQTSVLAHQKEILLKNNIVFHVDRVSSRYIKSGIIIRNVKVLHISIIDPRAGLGYINNRLVQINDDSKSYRDMDAWMEHQSSYMSDIIATQNPALLEHKSNASSNQISASVDISEDSMHQHFAPAPRAIAAFHSYRKAKDEYKQSQI